MTLLPTKKTYSNQKSFFECKLGDLLRLLSLFTALYHFWRQSFACSKPRAIRLFWRKNPRKRLDMKVLKNSLSFLFPSVHIHISYDLKNLLTFGSSATCNVLYWQSFRKTGTTGKFLAALE